MFFEIGKTYENKVTKRCIEIQTAELDAGTWKLQVKEINIFNLQFICHNYLEFEEWEQNLWEIVDII